MSAPDFGGDLAGADDTTVRAALAHAEFPALLPALAALVDDPTRPIAAIQAVLSRLLEARANPDRPDADGRTPLLRLLGSGRVEPSTRDETRLQPIVLTLLQGGANPNAPDRSGRTPLHWACRHGLVQSTNMSGATIRFPIASPIHQRSHAEP